MSTTDLLAATLKKHGYSVTKSRQAVFTALSGGEPLLMRDLVHKASDSDRASVYRTVDLFEKLGIVVRLQQGWKYKLELSDLFTNHHHHVTCENCGRTVAFDEPEAFETVIRNIAERNGFVAHSHQLEITGFCADCQKASVKAPKT